jgi:transcriptional regulator with XRE-family HTH domain
MAANTDRNPLTHFGKQVRKERLARGWSLREFAARTGLVAPYWSQIENGRRPPTEKIAKACDRVFPERRGYFLEYYEESKSWMPPGFRDWPEIENKAARLSEWSPGIVTGMLQTEGYAGGLLRTYPAVTEDIVAARLKARMDRQRRVLLRADDPPKACYIIDHAALYRCVGSPETMVDQMRHLSAVAAMPNVTMQILPSVAHPATQSGFLIADEAAYTEHVVGGLVFTDPETLTRLTDLFDMLRGECYRVSESAAIIRKAGELWTGASRATAEPTAETA